MPTSGTPRRRLDVESEILPDGSMVLYDPIIATAYPISESAALVWDACDGRNTTEAIVERLADVYDAPTERIGRDVRTLLTDFVNHGLLEHAE